MGKPFTLVRAYRICQGEEFGCVVQFTDSGLADQFAEAKAAAVEGVADLMTNTLAIYGSDEAESSDDETGRAGG